MVTGVGSEGVYWYKSKVNKGFAPYDSSKKKHLMLWDTLNSVYKSALMQLRENASSLTLSCPMYYAVWEESLSMVLKHETTALLPPSTICEH